MEIPRKVGDTRHTWYRSCVPTMKVFRLLKRRWLLHVEQVRFVMASARIPTSKFLLISFHMFWNISVIHRDTNPLWSLSPPTYYIYNRVFPFQMGCQVTSMEIRPSTDYTGTLDGLKWIWSLGTYNNLKYFSLKSEVTKISHYTFSGTNLSNIIWFVEWLPSFTHNRISGYCFNGNC